MPGKEENYEKYGEYAFLLGLVLVIIVGLASTVEVVANNLGTIYIILAALGLVVGFLNISEKEVNSFLIATIALMGVGTIKTALDPITKSLPVLATVLTNLLGAISVFVGPAALVVAVLAIYRLAKSK